MCRSNSTVEPDFALHILVSWLCFETGNRVRAHPHPRVVKDATRSNCSEKGYNRKADKIAAGGNRTRNPESTDTASDVCKRSQTSDKSAGSKSKLAERSKTADKLDSAKRVTAGLSPDRKDAEDEPEAPAPGAAASSVTTAVVKDQETALMDEETATTTFDVQEMCEKNNPDRIQRYEVIMDKVTTLSSQVLGLQASACRKSYGIHP